MSDDTDQQPIDGQVVEPTELTVAGNPKPWSRRSPGTLTPKQSAFVDAILSGMNPSQAYRSCYDCSKMNPATVARRAYDLCNNHGNIKAVIAAQKLEKATQIQVNKSLVLEKLYQNAERAAGNQTQRIKRLVNGEVVEVEAHFIDRSSANRAYELVGKEIGMFVDRREVGNPGDFERLQRQELESMIRDMLALDNSQDTDK